MRQSRYWARPLDARIQVQRREVPLHVRMRNGWVASGVLNLEEYTDLQELLEDATRETITLTAATLERPGTTEQLPTVEIPKREITVTHRC